MEVETGQVPLDVASRLVVRRLKSEVTLAGGRRLQEPVSISSRPWPGIEGGACPRPAPRRQPGVAGSEEDRYERAGARQKATGCRFLATLYVKRFGSTVAALRATLRRRLGLPPAARVAAEFPVIEREHLQAVPDTPTRSFRRVALGRVVGHGVVQGRPLLGAPRPG